MTFLSFLMKDLMKRRLRLALTVLGVTIGIAACVIMLGLSESIRGSFRSAYSKRSVDIVVYEKDNFDVISSRISATLPQEIRSMPEVKDAAGMLAGIERCGKGFLFIFGWPADSPYFDNIRMTSGCRPVAGAREAIIGMLLSGRPDLKDRTINIKGRDFKITGVYNSENPFEKSALIIPLDVFQSLDSGNSGRLTGVNVMLRDGYRTEEGIRRVAEAIEKKFPGVTAQNADVFIAEKTKQVVMGEKVSLLIAIIIIIAVVLGLANTMITAVFERRKLLGVLMALGWSKKDVFHVVLMESLLIMCFGGLIGAGLGFYAIDHLFNAMDLVLFLPAWDYVFVVKVIAFILLSGLTAALIPSWLIISIDPVEVIRSE